MRVVLTAIVLSVAVIGCQSEDDKSKTDSSGHRFFEATNPPQGDSGLQKIDLKEGTGPEAKIGDNVQVNYTGWLKDGTKIDSSLDAGRQPLTFQLGDPHLIKGWHEGIAGMKIGGKRKLIIPSNLAYGERGRAPKVPPNAELTFEIELLKIN